MLFCFFFFKQKTAYEMRISDWSSDVCSSDLSRIQHRREVGEQRVARRHARERSVGGQSVTLGEHWVAADPRGRADDHHLPRLVAEGEGGAIGVGCSRALDGDRAA